MSRLILHLGQQNRLAFQGWGAGDPIALGQLSYDFRMRMLRDLTDQGFAIARGHPILWLNLFACINARLEGVQFRTAIRIFRLYHLCIHQITPYTRSKIRAVPCPTPTHMVHSA